MAARPPPHPSARRIATPAVRAKILAAIGRKLQPADRDDVMQRTYIRLFALLDRLPEGDEELLGLVGVVTHGQVVDQHRRTTVRDGRLVEESEAADVEESPEVATPEQSVEWKALYDLAERAANDGLIPPESLGWAERLARGDTYEQIGADEGLPAATVRKRMERVRKILRERWREATGLTGAILGVVLLFFWLRRPVEPGIVPEAYVPQPSVTAAPAEETAEQKMARFTSQAQALCDRHEFDDCEAVLDEAKDIDTRNEDRPEVIKMRHAIHDASKKPQRLKP
jgi:DNA-directed RNA polymerase specialized sigma24 family protein